MDEHGIIKRNKSKLMVQGYNQKESIDYDATFAQWQGWKLSNLRLFCNFHGIQIVAKGCNKCILEWLIEGRGLCKVTPWV